MQQGDYYLRAARSEDMELVYEWANDPETRRNSFSSDQITLAEHKTWYERQLHSDESKLFIMVYKGTDVGQVRLKSCGESAEISYSIAPDFRCMGYGKIILSLIAQKAKAEFPDIKSLTAQVKPENIASRKALISAGYTEKCSVYTLEIESFKKLESESIKMGG